jgi:hypothetical protein
VLSDDLVARADDERSLLFDEHLAMHLDLSWPA